MAYGRYDRGRESRDPRGTRSVWDDDRSGPRYSGDRDERGFFERAGDEISSWFGDDDRGRRGPEDRRYNEGHRAGEMGGDPFDRSARHRDEGYRRPYTGRSGGFDDPGRRESGYQPMTGDYGRSSRFDRDRERGSSFSGMAPTTTPHDRHYDEWRQRQISELDRDYDEYRRENQSRFEDDFSSWRTTRQSKRQMLGSIAPHMQVFGSDDQPVGTVDKVRGDRIILTKDDSPDGQHHSLGCGHIDRVESDRVILDKKADEAKSLWGSEERDRALFERDDDREVGAHILERSFSGTY
jgi:hypothetical protein